MLLLDWIEKNKDKFLDSIIESMPSSIYGVRRSLYGEELIKYASEIENLEDFNDIEINFLNSPRFEKIDSRGLRSIQVGEVEININSWIKDNGKNLNSLFAKQISRQKNPESYILYLYEIRISELPPDIKFGMRYAITDDEEYAKNKKRTRLIDEMTKN